MHSLAHGYSSVLFPHFMFNQAVNDHRFALRNEGDFFVPRTNLTTVQKMPLIDFPSCWNNIDQSLKEITSKVLFKKNCQIRAT